MLTAKTRLANHSTPEARVFCSIPDDVAFVNLAPGQNAVLSLTSVNYTNNGAVPFTCWTDTPNRGLAVASNNNLIATPVGGAVFAG